MHPMVREIRITKDMPAIDPAVFQLPDQVAASSARATRNTPGPMPVRVPTVDASTAVGAYAEPSGPAMGPLPTPPAMPVVVEPKWWSPKLRRGLFIAFIAMSIVSVGAGLAVRPHHSLVEQPAPPDEEVTVVTPPPPARPVVIVASDETTQVVTHLEQFVTAKTVFHRGCVADDRGLPRDNPADLAWVQRGYNLLGAHISVGNGHGRVTWSYTVGFQLAVGGSAQAELGNIGPGTMRALITALKSGDHTRGNLGAYTPRKLVARAPKAAHKHLVAHSDTSGEDVGQNGRANASPSEVEHEASTTAPAPAAGATAAHEAVRKLLEEALPPSSAERVRLLVTNGPPFPGALAR